MLQGPERGTMETTSPLSDRVIDKVGLTLDKINPTEVVALSSTTAKEVRETHRYSFAMRLRHAISLQLQAHGRCGMRRMTQNQVSKLTWCAP